MQSRLIEGRIKNEWAEVVSTAGSEIWDFNRAAFEDVESRVNLQTLGGLVLQLSEAVIDDTKAEEMARNNSSFINLAFGKPGRLVWGFTLATAAEARGTEADLALAETISKRGTYENGRSIHPLYDAIWLIPDAAIEDVQMSMVDVG